ncbi:PRC-barrel domain-containing protein [Jannaschia marina]|uniref:PRC-barrel domain-containing protein n=1 Tax=Jannaschia marina TaxID=2741674 RepID=UPI0015CAC5F0|nr:PRC-barrel domain-containing protein [Jannaschia marina]
MKKLFLTTAAAALTAGLAFAQEAEDPKLLQDVDAEVEATEAPVGDDGSDVETAEDGGDAAAPLATEEAETDLADGEDTTLPADDGNDTDMAEDNDATTPVDGTDTDVAEGSGDTMNTADDDTTLYGAFADTAVRDLVGKNVMAQTGDSVGEVESLVSEGEEVHAVVGVGGFLGLGEHDVAIPLTEFTDSEDGLVLPNMTQEELEAMAAFEGEAEELPMDVTVSGEPVAVEDPMTEGGDDTAMPVETEDSY